MQEITKKIQKYCIHFMDIINMNYRKCHYIYTVYYNDQNAAYIYTYISVIEQKQKDGGMLGFNHIHKNNISFYKKVQLATVQSLCISKMKTQMNLLHEIAE